MLKQSRVYQSRERKPELVRSSLRYSVMSPLGEEDDICLVRPERVQELPKESKVSAMMHSLQKKQHEKPRKLDLQDELWLFSINI